MTDDQSRDRGADSVLAPGTKAPEFTLKSIPGQSYSLSDFRGKPLVMAFYPADWSPVCGDQMALYNEMREEFSSYGAQLVGVSVDASGATKPSRKRGASAFHCCRISSRREKFPGGMGRTTPRMASPGARSSSSMEQE